MKTAYRIVLYSLCLILTLSWVTPAVSNIIQTTTEKKSADKKEALPEDKTEKEEKKNEIVLEFSVPYSIPFQALISTDFNFCKGIALPKSVTLDLSNPPPEFYLFA